LRQNQIGTIATANISVSPRPKRCICGSTQGVMDPPATEKSIRKPRPATATSRRTSAQFRYRILRQPRGCGRHVVFEETHVRSVPCSRARGGAARWRRGRLEDRQAAVHLLDVAALGHRVELGRRECRPPAPAAGCRARSGRRPRRRRRHAPPPPTRRSAGPRTARSPRTARGRGVPRAGPRSRSRPPRVPRRDVAHLARAGLAGVR
jgi:hypothetical protein